MRSINNFWSKTNKVFLYSSSVVFKNYKSYLQTILLPMVISLLVLAIRTRFFSSVINPSAFPAIFLVPSITLIMFFSTILLDWRKSIFIKQMRNFGVNKYSFILGFTSTTFLCSLMATTCGIFYIYLFSFISSGKLDSFNNWANFVTNITQVIGIIVSIIFASIISSFVAIVFTGYLKNIYVIQTINIVLIVFFLAFSDILISPQESSSIKALCIIGYFDPYKYTSWITFMLNGKMNLNFYNVYFFVVNIDGYISFTKIWQPIIGALVMIIITGSASTLLFSISTKK